MDSMENLDFSATLKTFQVGEPVEAYIVQISDDTVFIDVGAKSEGFIEKAELTDKDGNLTVKEGDTVKAFYMPSQKRRDELRFTTKLGGNKADSDNAGNAAKEILENAFNSGIPVEGKVKSEIKGGYEVEVSGTRTFCPYSQMGYRTKAEPAEYVGKTLSFIITEFKNNGRNIVVSNKKILEAEANEKLNEVSKTLTEGTIVKATVKSLQSYGAFVEIADTGIQALLPISEVSHQRVNDISTVLSEGQEIEAKIIKSDFEEGKRPRISVSTKELEKDPWEGVAAKYPAGTKLTAKIARIAGFGLFINLEPGIDGLLHTSALGLKPNTNLSKKYKIGDELEVIVSSVDEAAKKVSLSIEGSAAETPNKESNTDNSTREFLARQKNDNSGETYNPFKDLLK